uniref:Uncharacterized protein n=1 Tax=Vespula pensylvanica TaxID=30213 RepID=A0A834NAV3_VESPE|nr:hypothetical protein H0235_015536 [Vespula pensylvanica]
MRIWSYVCSWYASKGNEVVGSFGALTITSTSPPLPPLSPLPPPHPPPPLAPTSPLPPPPLPGSSLSLGKSRKRSWIKFHAKLVTSVN